MLINKLSRDTALKIHYMLDQWIPPILRDQWWFMQFPLRMVFGKNAVHYKDFKQRICDMSPEEYVQVYALTNDTAMQRETDLNRASIELIRTHVAGEKILDVGCGRGFLANILRHDFKVTATDIIIPSGLRESQPNVEFIEASVEKLPFPDHAFDMVICTHTLEHVQNMPAAIKELRRVAKKRIIVVPRQRPYKYTFDLHINFFPYLHSLRQTLGPVNGNVICIDADGDIFYFEQENGW